MISFKNISVSSVVKDSMTSERLVVIPQTNTGSRVKYITENKKLEKIEQ